MGSGSTPTPAHHEVSSPIAVQFAVMEPTDWNRIFVADLSTKRTRLGKANMVRFARRPATNDAGLRRNIFTVLLLTQANGLGDETTRMRRGLIVQDHQSNLCPLQ